MRCFVRNLMLILFFGSICLVPSFSEAAEASAAPKIAVINMQKVVRESKVGRKATSQLNQQFEHLQKILQAKQDAIKAFKDDFEKKAPLMSEEARTEKELEYKKMVRDFKEQSDDAQLEMRKAEAKVMEPILKVLEKVVTKIGESGGYSIILESNMPGLYYVSPAIDITDSVIKAYDQESAGQSQPSKSK
ncbi:MAG: OmpH family outer membrane protein [Dissulfurimicrobium sp.]|uniref:OmpH family outer membrane protein n=2 Tax=Dissulfurimicrobium TaxID=1769732 RepID=UPI003C718D85